MSGERSERMREARPARLGAVALAAAGLGLGLGLAGACGVTWDRPALETGSDGSAGWSGTASPGAAAAPGGAGSAEQASAGTLTAGSFDDNHNPGAFRRFMGEVGQRGDVGGVGGVAARFAGAHVRLLVQDRLGRPIGGTRLRVEGTDRYVVTKSSGEAALIGPWDGIFSGDTLTVRVRPPSGGEHVAVVPVGDGRAVIELDAPAGSLPVRLDLALVVDATGSMSDEMHYLKAEIEGIAQAVHARFPNVDQRYALCVYRDDGDQYLTRAFDFTDDLGAFRRSLGEQHAGGGGDYPEAMHAAIEQAAGFAWREQHASVARVLFLVADAPPHAQHAERTLAAVESLRRKGVVVYPIAASGVAEAAEAIMRASAALTSGQYLFLTDDSGVGNTHAEPHIPCYHVERLAGLMTRMVASELSGHRLDPRPEDIIRTVGRPVDGACAPDPQAVSVPVTGPGGAVPF